MKRYASVFALLARSSVFRILGVCLLMGAAEAVSFELVLQNRLGRLVSDDRIPRPEELLEASHFALFFGLAFLAVTVLLALVGTEFRTKTSYTWKSLLLSERQILLCQALYNILAYLFLLAAQVAVAFLLCMRYAMVVPASFVSNQTLFLAFWRSDLLHSLLPLSELSLWIRNGVLLVTLGTSVAEYPFKQRRKKMGLMNMAFCVFTLLAFVRGIGDFFNTFLVLFICVIAWVEILYVLLGKEDGYENV